MTDVPAPIVHMEGINKSFSGVPVLVDVDFEVVPGEVHALAGGNGAGKSTLMKILQGVYGKDSGTITIAGEVRELKTIDDAKDAGIGMVFQEFSLVPTMTVAQNVYLGDEITGAGRLLDERQMLDGTVQVLRRMGLTLDPKREIGDLATGYWQLTEIAKALHRDARVLIMDEPTASLSRQESEMLFELIGRLREQGVAIIYISHRMEEVYRIADRITILSNGSRLLTARLTEITPAQIVAGIVGKELAVEFGTAAESRPVGKELLTVEGLASKEGLDGVSLSLHAGEVVGLAGLMGSGRSEVARALFGIDHVTSGTIRLDGDAAEISSPTDAMAAGIGLIPEDRREQGLMLDHSVRENLVLTLLAHVRNGPLLSNKRIRGLATELISRFQVKASAPQDPVRLLSGGNQQKVVIAKWLGRDPDILIMDEPTAGVDIGTKVEIVGMIDDLAAQGKGVIFISSEFPEMLAACHRFLLMKHGSIVGELRRDEVKDEESLQLAIQGSGL